MSEYGEPWKSMPLCSQDGRSETGIIHDANGNELGELNGDVARRVLACVNACAGIPSEQLAPLQWRKEPPDQEGWWWFKTRSGCIDIRHCLECTNGQFLVYGPKPFAMLPTDDKWVKARRWAGPIPPPT